MNKIIKTIIALPIIAITSIVYIKAKSYFEEYTSDFIDESFYSATLKEDRKIFIRRPRSYDEDKSYPLIIKTDGNFNLEQWDKQLKELGLKGKAEDSIVVAIPNQFWTDTRNRDLVPPYARKDVNIEARPASENDPEIFGRADKFLAFIEKELLPYIESKYPINDNKILTGFSAGGSFVLYTFTTKPELFTGYFAFSPAAWYDKSVVVKEFKKQLPTLTGVPKYLYLSLGSEENEIITGSFQGLLKALEQSAPENIYWGHSYSAGAGHNENPSISIPKAITEYYQFRKKYFPDWKQTALAE
ncbi:alpha/beta hydrolase [Pseudoalteromonas sp. T1lg65]|uniref:alpha/beta hydrolase n=1 Tax=Pseudoalteromonas sp. T1lg65 TaxID=2077101 RepID=UPI003F795678